jgi:isoquinoline 1-oxidoreductase subunit alpha
MSTVKGELKVNGKFVHIEVDAEMPLLWVLREQLGLTGTKFGCGMAQCGVCTVHAYKEGSGPIAIRSCTKSITEVLEAKMEIVTIEGLDSRGEHPVQQAWIKHSVPQCGYCQPGQIMSAAALLANNPNANAESIDRAMAGNLCRCGTYCRIKNAILDLAGEK